MDDIKYIRKNLKQALLKSYYTNAYAQILPLEKLRVALSLITIILYLILVSMTCYIIVSLIISRDNIRFELLLYLFATNIIFSIIGALKGHYKKKIKKFYPQIVKAVGLNYCSARNIHGIAKIISESKLFPSAYHSKEDDIFFGEYKNVGLTIAETKIIDNGYSNKYSTEKKSPITLFKGIIITLDANKNIKSTTLIKPKYEFSALKKIPEGLIILFWGLFGFLIMIGCLISMVTAHHFIEYLPGFLFGLSFFGTFGYWFYDSAIRRELDHNKGLKKMKLEDVKFSKYYQAYSLDQVEGRYLLTPAFIERFTYLSKVFHTKNLRCSFVNNNLVIAIASKKDEFEVCGLHTSLKNPKHIDKFVNQIAAILLIADYLKLYEKTGL